MKKIRYRVITGDGDQRFVDVFARTINSGFTKALDQTKRVWLFPGEEISRIEFWEVRT